MRSSIVFVMVLSLGCSQLSSLSGYTFGNADAAVGSDAGPTPSTPRLTFPWNGWYSGSLHATAGLSPRLRWEVAANADRYEVQLSDACTIAERSTCAFSGSLEGSTSSLE